MKLSITSVDYAPPEIERAMPIQVDLTRQLPGDNRSDYWLGTLTTPLEFMDNNQLHSATYVIFASRWVGHPIAPQVQNVPINPALVLDESQIHEQRVDLSKSKFIAIGIANEIGKSGRLEAVSNFWTRSINKAFKRGANK